MITHLQPREHYEDLYDSWTVESCRRMAAHKLEATDEDFVKAELTPEQITAMKDIKDNWSEVAKEMAVFGFAAERFSNKDQMIDEWMQKDRDHDDRLAKIQPPDHVRCRECLSTALHLISQDEHWGTDTKQERILFMYKCDRCDTNTAYFDNGEQFHVKPTLCPKCKNGKPAHTTTKSEHQYTITYTCSVCDHVWDEVMDFTPSPQPEADPTYNEDRKLYCYSEKIREWAESAQRIGPLMKDIAEHQAHKAKVDEHKNALAKIKKLTIPQIIEALRPVIEKAGYSDVKFSEPEIGKYVTVKLSCMDGKSDSDDHTSSSLLKKTIAKALASTNWRLMSNGVSYRLGYLTCQIKAYETEDDLLRLME